MDDGLATLDEEHLGWHELLALINALTPDERQLPGYFTDPDWSVVDVVGHVGAWLAEAHLQLERIVAGTYRPHEVDIDGINAQLLDAMRGQSWTVTWTQANSARTMLLLRWAASPGARTGRALVDPEGRPGALRGAPAPASRVGRRARRAARRLRSGRPA